MGRYLEVGALCKCLRTDGRATSAVKDTPSEVVQRHACYNWSAARHQAMTPAIPPATVAVTSR